MRTPCAALDSPLLQAELSPAAGRRADSPPAAARVLDSTAPRRASMARGPGARNARSQAWSHSNTPSRSSSTAVIVRPALRGRLAFKRRRRQPHAAQAAPSAVAESG